MDEQAHIERNLHEHHDYVRHVFQLFIAWFTFFATVNYATLGWLSRSSQNLHTVVGRTVIGMFIVQNLLGLGACRVVRSYLRDQGHRCLVLERRLVRDTPNPDPALTYPAIPTQLYSGTMILMALALLTITIAWEIIGYSAI